MSLQDGIRAVQRAFTDSPPARWPLYVRQAKQHLRTAIDGFDERKYGFASVVDLLRAAGKEGVVRIERDRQGAIRVFPGGNIAPKPAMPVDEPEMLDGDISADTSSDTEPNFNTESGELVSVPVADQPIVDVEPVLVDERVDACAKGRAEAQDSGAARSTCGESRARRETAGAQIHSSRDRSRARIA